MNLMGDCFGYVASLGRNAIPKNVMYQCRERNPVCYEDGESLSPKAFGVKVLVIS